MNSYAPDLRAWPHRRPADDSARLDARNRRLALPAPIRLTERVASTLDAIAAGGSEIGPEGTNFAAKQLYFPDTAVLITRFRSADGVDEVAPS